MRHDVRSSAGHCGAVLFVRLGKCVPVECGESGNWVREGHRARMQEDDKTTRTPALAVSPFVFNISGFVVTFTHNWIV